MYCAHRLRERRWTEPGRWRLRLASPAIPPASIRRAARLRGTENPRPLAGVAVYPPSCCFPPAHCFGFRHELIPTPPERAQLKIGSGAWVLAFPAARELGPVVPAIGRPAPTRFV